MRLETLSASTLREVCVRLGLDDSGPRWLMAMGIEAVVTVGAHVSVYCQKRRSGAWKDGIIVDTHPGSRFEVMFNEDLKLKVLDITDTFIVLSDPGAVSDGAASFDSDVAATEGLAPGTRLMVEHELLFGRRSDRVLVGRPATLGRALRGKRDEEGRKVYYLTYDAISEYGLPAEKVKVSFIDGDTLDEDGEERSWCLMEESEEEEEEEESDEYETDEEEEEKPRGRHYRDGLEDITGGMAGLGVEADRPRTRALIVACAYKGAARLNGTLNDASAIHSLLVDHFQVPNTKDNIMLLTDDHHDSMLLPTKRNILKGFDWLMGDLLPGDSLFFYFSGHGGTEDDPSGRERRGFQTICPCDYKSAGVIKDTEIHEKLVKPLPQQTTLHALIDSCHSGTAMNLPWNAILKRGYMKGWEEEYPGKTWKMGTAGGLAVQFSAGRHDQYAGEAATGYGGAQGAATYAFTKAIQRHMEEWGFDIVYVDLLQAMREELKRDGRFKDQEPMMSASTQFDPERPDIRLRI